MHRRARLKAQFNAIPIPTYSWQKIDDDFELVDFNASAAGITEGKISQLVGARASVLYSEEPEIVSFMHKAFDQQLTETHELKYALKTTGAVRDLRVTFGFGPPDLLVVHTEDITERKQAEEAARENSARTRGILENVADGVVTMTEDGLIESVNPAAERIFGYAVSEMVGNPVTMLMTGMDGKNHDRYLRQYVQTGKSGILGAGARELKARRKDGSTFPIGLAVSEMQSADRRIFIGSIRDITIRKQAERAIERKTALLKDTLDSMGQGLIVIDGTLTVLAANHRVIKMLRAPEGLLVEGADFGKFIEYAAARGDYGPGELEGIIAYQRSMALGAEAHTFDRTMPDGTHFEAQAIPRPTGGFVITYTDVTERIAAKEELRRSQSSLAIAQRIAHLGSWEMDIATGEGAWSDEMFRMYGYQPGEVKPSFEVVKAAAHPDDQETVIKKFRDACDPSVPDFDHEYRIVRNDGSERVVHSRWEMMRDDEGKPNKIVGVVHDITERVRAGESVREALLQAETANRSKSEFLANMSHELRTPLNAIIGFSQVLQDELKGPLGDPSYRQYVRDIHESGTLLLSLINDILDLSKIEAGKLELQDVKQNIPEIVGACRRIIDGRAKEAGLMLDTRLSDGLPHLQVDERALKQILLNLLSNAVKFTPEGGSIAVDARIDDDGCFAIIISDTGIGIAPAEIPNALSNFGQVENYLTREKQGTGLGLPLAKSLAEAHGGTLELESELGRGTTVTVRFPAERVGEASVAMVRSREAGAA